MPRAAHAGSTCESSEPLPPPHDVTDLCGLLPDTPGILLHDLIATLTPSQETAEAALRKIVMRTQRLASASTSNNAAP
jgi:hypothetical protein